MRLLLTFASAPFSALVCRVCKLTLMSAEVAMRNMKPGASMVRTLTAQAPTDRVTSNGNRGGRAVTPRKPKGVGVEVGIALKGRAPERC